jgi:hypothetical protein
MFFRILREGYARLKLLRLLWQESGVVLKEPPGILTCRRLE